jgi:hypothetical protein
MQKQITISVTPSQMNTITMRANENGFDDVQAYVKVAALKTHPFNLTPAGSDHEVSSESISIELNDAQYEKIEENVKECNCKSIEEYVVYVSLHCVVSAVVEVRSTGSFDDMLARIAAQKAK